MSRVKRSWIELDWGNADAVYAGDISYGSSHTVEEAIDVRLGIDSSLTYVAGGIIEVKEVMAKTKAGHSWHGSQDSVVIVGQDSGKSFTTGDNAIGIVGDSSLSKIPNELNISKRFQQSVGIKMDGLTPESIYRDSFLFPYSQSTGDSLRVSQYNYHGSGPFTIQTGGDLGESYVSDWGFTYTSTNLLPVASVIKDYVDTQIGGIVTDQNYCRNNSTANPQIDEIVIYVNGTTNDVGTSGLRLIDFTGHYSESIDAGVQPILGLTKVDDYYLVKSFKNQSATRQIYINNNSTADFGLDYRVPTENVIASYVSNAISIAIGGGGGVSRNTSTGDFATNYGIALWMSDNSKLAFDVATLSQGNWITGSASVIPSTAACDARFALATNAVNRWHVDWGVDTGTRIALASWQNPSNTSDKLLALNQVYTTGISRADTSGWNPNNDSVHRIVPTIAACDARFVKYGTGSALKRLAAWEDNTSSPPTLATNNYYTVQANVDSWSAVDANIPTTLACDNRFARNVFKTQSFTATGTFPSSPTNNNITPSETMNWNLESGVYLVMANIRFVETDSPQNKDFDLRYIEFVLRNSNTTEIVSASPFYKIDGDPTTSSINLEEIVVSGITQVQLDNGKSYHLTGIIYGEKTSWSYSSTLYVMTKLS